MAVEIREYTPEDAAAVARLYQASDSAWPGGFVDGLLVPPEAIAEDVETEDAFARFLAWEDGLVVGYADLYDIPGDDKAAYLGLLTGDPAYHGRGVGRDLIRRCVDRCVERELELLTLGTWPGNTRAVPLYKKTGFHWGPEVSEEWYSLANFVPMLLRHPLTKPYFARVDWYACQKRALQLGLDAERRDGALVFPYAWEGEAGALRAVYDQKARKLVELETPEITASLTVPEAEMLRGAKQTARLVLANRRDEALAAAITATGADAVSADHYRTLTVPAGSAETVELEVGTDKEKTGDGKLELRLLLGAHELRMAATVKVVAPVELWLEPSAPPLVPGRAATVTLNARNRTERPAEVALRASATDGLEVTLPVEPLRLEAGAFAGLAVGLRAARTGVYALSLRPFVMTEGESAAYPAVTLDAAAVGPGELAVLVGGDETTVHTDRVVVTVSKKGSGYALRDRRTGASLGGEWAEIGPPFWPDPAEKEEAALSVERRPDAAVITARKSLPHLGGVEGIRTVTVRADGRTRLGVELRNLGTENKPRGIVRGLNRPDQHLADYLPLEDGVVRGVGGMPAWTWFGPGSLPPFSARWIALEGAGGTVGALWPDGYTAKSSGWNRLMLESPRTPLAPGEARTYGAVELVPTEGGWRAVEREWRAAEGIEADGASPVLPAVGARLAPTPLLVAEGAAATARVETRSLHPRTVDGSVAITAPEGFTASPETLQFAGVSSAAETSAEIRVERASGAGPGAAELALDARLPTGMGRSTGPVIALGTAGGRVSVEEAEAEGETIWRVGNGWMTFAVRPAVLGSVYALASPEGERLYANFPTPLPRHWDYPVYGGIRPLLWEPGGHHPDNQGRLGGVPFTAEPARRDGPQGAVWEGVLVRADAEYDALRGLRLEVEYLTTPGSNVLAVVGTLRSLGPARRARYVLELNPANQPERPLLLLPDQLATGRAGEHGDMQVSGERFVTVEYPADGRATLLAATGGAVGAFEMGPAGSVLSGTLETTVPAGGERRVVHYIALAADRRQAGLYAELARLAFP